MEECGEVIQAATKILRFGWDRNEPGYGINHEVLAKEVGDLKGVIDSLDLDHVIVNNHRQQKIEKAIAIKEKVEKDGII